MRIERDFKWILHAKVVHLATAFNPKMLPIILKNCLSVINCKTSVIQFSPLHIASTIEDSTTTFLLINFGADVEAKDNKGIILQVLHLL